MNIREIVDTHPHGYQERFNRYSRGNGNRARESGSFSSDSTASNEEKPSITIPIGFSPRTASNSGSEVRRSKTVPDTMGKYLKDDDQDSKRRLIANIAVRGQGVDVSDMDSVFNCIERQVDVTTVDMSRSQYTVNRDMKNGQFLDWLKQPRPQWSTVRWININGMSWDVIKAIAIEYDLHHLAVEDLLHVPQRTKVDMYPKQTYISCTLLTLMETLEDGQLRQVDPFDSPHGINPDMLSQRLPLDKLDSYKHYHYTERQSYEKLQVQMEQVAIFLLQDGTVITLFQVSGQSVADPIIERLAHDYSLTRKHSDASFLLQSIIDGIVDHAIPITDAFRHEINDLETHVLAMPRMAFTRDLHRMTAQLSMLKRTLVPTQMLVHSLRGKDERSPLSSLARIYMGDVMDHCSTMVEDIDSMLNLCEKLINMIFNLIAYDTNASMRRLALVSIIFLPITFVAGVYGTNFKDFPELEHNVGYFWIICGVVIAVFALPPRTRMYIGIGGMAFAMAGLYISDALEERLDPAKRSTNTAGTPPAEPRANDLTGK
ncbi:hypothetical protein BGZ67_007509 [Mortierella alpina]|nr:hypothetical protein BGZ67_007509 [Mortierella alpina]